MFSKIRAELSGIRRSLEILPSVLADLSENLQTPERLAALEGELASVVGEARALITEAEAKFAATRASEERTRHQVKRLERLQELEEGDEEGDERLLEQWAELQERNARGGQNGGVPPVRQAVDLSGESGEALAEAWKWGAR